MANISSIMLNGSKKKVVGIQTVLNVWFPNHCMWACSTIDTVSSHSAISHHFWQKIITFDTSRTLMRTFTPLSDAISRPIPGLGMTRLSIGHIIINK